MLFVQYLLGIKSVLVALLPRCLFFAWNSFAWCPNPPLIPGRKPRVGGMSWIHAGNPFLVQVGKRVILRWSFPGALFIGIFCPNARSLCQRNYFACNAFVKKILRSPTSMFWQSSHLSIFPFWVVLKVGHCQFQWAFISTSTVSNALIFGSSLGPLELYDIAWNQVNPDCVQNQQFTLQTIWENRFDDSFWYHVWAGMFFIRHFVLKDSQQ